MVEYLGAGLLVVREALGVDVAQEHVRISACIADFESHTGTRRSWLHFVAIAMEASTAPLAHRNHPRVAETTHFRVDRLFPRYILRRTAIFHMWTFCRWCIAEVCWESFRGHDEGRLGRRIRGASLGFSFR